jgi:hypothetical protein
MIIWCDAKLELAPVGGVLACRTERTRNWPALRGLSCRPLQTQGNGQHLASRTYHLVAGNEMVDPSLCTPDPIRTSEAATGSACVVKLETARCVSSKEYASDVRHFVEVEIVDWCHGVRRVCNGLK